MHSIIVDGAGCFVLEVSNVARLSACDGGVGLIDQAEIDGDCAASCRAARVDRAVDVLTSLPAGPPM